MPPDEIMTLGAIVRSPKVLKRTARALFHEYGISIEDMAADFPVLVGGRRRSVAR